MFSIKQVDVLKTIKHEESGASFEIRPLSPRKHAELQKQSMRPGKKDEVDVITFSGNAAKFLINNWWAVAEECTEENKFIFGENLAFLIMPWLIEEASSLHLFIQQEKTTAKKG